MGHDISIDVEDIVFLLELTSAVFFFRLFHLLS